MCARRLDMHPKSIESNYDFFRDWNVHDAVAGVAWSTNSHANPVNPEVREAQTGLLV